MNEENSPRLYFQLTSSVIPTLYPYCPLAVPFDLLFSLVSCTNVGLSRIHLTGDYTADATTQ